MFFGLWKSKWQQRAEDAVKLIDIAINKHDALQEKMYVLQGNLDLAQGQLQKSHYRVTELEAKIKHLEGKDIPQITHSEQLGDEIEAPRIHSKNDFKRNKKPHPRNGAHHNNP